MIDTFPHITAVLFYKVAKGTTINHITVVQSCKVALWVISLLFKA